MALDVERVVDGAMNARRGLRERQRLVKERTAHENRIKGLLKTQGIMDFDPRAADAAARLDATVTGDGRPLAPCLKREIARELERLALVMRQIDQVETAASSSWSARRRSARRRSGGVMRGDYGLAVCPHSPSG
jgi:transposase